jgi:hypothetical protein
VTVFTAKMKARVRTATGEERARLCDKALEFWPPLRRLPAQHGAQDPRGRAGRRPLNLKRYIGEFDKGEAP